MALILTIDGTSLTHLRQQLLELTSALVTSPEVVDKLEDPAPEPPAVGQIEPVDAEPKPEPTTTIKKPRGFQKGNKMAAKAKEAIELNTVLDTVAKTGSHPLLPPQVTGDTETDLDVLDRIKSKVSARYTEKSVRDATTALLATYGVKNFNLVPLNQMSVLSGEVDRMLAGIPEGA